MRFVRVVFDDKSTHMVGFSLSPDTTRGMSVVLMSRHNYSIWQAAPVQSHNPASYLLPELGKPKACHDLQHWSWKTRDVLWTPQTLSMLYAQQDFDSCASPNFSPGLSRRRLRYAPPRAVERGLTRPLIRGARTRYNQEVPHVNHHT